MTITKGNDYYRNLFISNFTHLDLSDSKFRDLGLGNRSLVVRVVDDRYCDTCPEVFCYFNDTLLLDTEFKLTENEWKKVIEVELKSDPAYRTVDFVLYGGLFIVDYKTIMRELE